MRAGEYETIEIEEPELQATCRNMRDAGVAEIIAGYDLCQALFAFHEVGLAGKLLAGGAIATASIVEGLDEALATALLRYLAIRGVLESVGDGYRLTERGKLLCGAVPMGLIGYHVEAYGPVIQRLAPLLTGSCTYGSDITRDFTALGRHCGVMSPRLINPLVLRVLEGRGARCIVDLGCGDACLLIDACKRSPGITGIGVDISSDCVDFARKRVAREGLADRIQVIAGDAFRPSTWPDVCREADAYVMIGTLHEHFREGEEAVVRLLDQYADLLAGGKKALILGEPEIHYDERDADFFLVHAATKQGYPRRKELWLPVFEQTRLRCRKLYHAPNVPFRFVYYELVCD